MLKVCSCLNPATVAYKFKSQQIQISPVNDSVLYLASLMLVSSCSNVYSGCRIDDQSVVVSQVSTAAAVSGKTNRITINSNHIKEFENFFFEILDCRRILFKAQFLVVGFTTAISTSTRISWAISKLLTSTLVNNC